MSEVVPEIYYGSLCLTDYPYAIGREEDGLDLGSPEKVMELIETLMANGDITLSSGESNRSLSVPVYIMGGTLMEVAQAEAALQLECDKDYNEFTLIPGGLGAATVFDTYAANSPHDRNDLHEAALLRHWTLSIPAAPRPRSAEALVTTAVPTTDPPTTTVISDGTSTIGWTPSNGVLSTVSGALRLGSSAPVTEAYQVAMSKSGLALDFNDEPDLYFDWRPINGAVTAVSVFVDGAPLTLSGWGPSPLGGTWTRAVFRGAGTTSTISLTFTFKKPLLLAGTYATVEVDNVATTNIGPVVTPFQRTLILPIGGAAPTEGSIHVSHATDALGDVMVYTCEPDSLSYAPNLRRYYTSGAGFTADSSLVSGGRNSLDTAWTADVPAAHLPAGSYTVWARLRSNTVGAQAVTWFSSAIVNTDNTVDGSTSTFTTFVTFAATNTWGLYPLGRVMLPGAAVPRAVTDMIVRITLAATTPAASDIDLDEAWVFNSTIGTLSVVEGRALTGSTPPVARNVWIDTPTIDRPTPTIWRGTAADRSDSYGAGAFVKSWGRHELTPTEQVVFVVTTAAQNVTVGSEHYPRWPNYAAN